MNLPRHYTHADAQEAQRKLQAMLPGNVKVHSGVYNDSMTLGLVVANRAKVSRLYEFGLTGHSETCAGKFGTDISNMALLEIASDWANGQPAVKPESSTPITTEPYTKEVANRDDFLAWYRSVKPGDKVLYFRGDVATFRHNGPIRIAQLQKLSDTAKPSAPRPPSESVEINQIQDMLELLQTVTTMSESNLIAMTKRRAVEGDGWICYATKRERR
jgi:hypothetical protein